jgi:hypothetical protein
MRSLTLSRSRTDCRGGLQGLAVWLILVINTVYCRNLFTQGGGLRNIDGSLDVTWGS